MPDAEAPRRKLRKSAGATCLLIDGVREPLSSRISQIGFGSYQLQCFALCCGFIVAEASELAMASGVAQCVAAEYSLDTEIGISSLMTATFAGLAFGTLLSGPLGDLCGRRLPMLVGSIGIPTMAVLTYMAPGLRAVYILRCLLGVFAGLGIPMAFVVLSEVTPREMRGATVAVMGLAWAGGEFYAAMGLQLMAPDLQQGPWRRLVLWAAGPSLKLLICGAFAPAARYDTVQWLGAQGRTQEAAAAINAMARMNGHEELSLQSCRLLSLEVGARHSSSALVGPPFLGYVFALGLLSFAKDFALYGSAVLWPLAWTHVHVFGTLTPAKELMYTALLGVPGVALAVGLMHAVPRRQALAVAGAACALACRAIAQLEEHSSLGLAGVATFRLCFPTWQMVTMLLPAEVFPTRVKARGSALVTLMGRSATVAAPAVVGTSQGGFLAATGALALLASLVVFLLPETSGEELSDVEEDSDSYGAT